MLRRPAQRFWHNTSGATAVIFGLALLPICIAVGAAVDYTRAANGRTGLQLAVDSAALAAAREGAKMDDASLSQFGRQFFDANFKARDINITDVNITRSDKRIRVSARGGVDTSILQLFGLKVIDVAADAQVGWGTSNIELALVLDNTGSMAQSGKLPALKQAVNKLLDILEKSAPDPDTYKVSVVPFTTQVNVGAAAKAADWLGFNLLGINPAQLVDQAGWAGCVIDRDKPFDTDASPRSLTDPRTLYPAVKCAQANLAQLKPLTKDFASLRSVVNTMQASGNTNVTIGVAWGLTSLTPGAPLSAAQSFGKQNLTKIMIVLTDGDNTQNRFTNNGNAIDPRTQQACTEAKQKGVRVYSIRVIAGNASLLRNCATSPSMYYEVQNASELEPAFRAIADEISSIRLTQ
jgi:Flp pilus assembly protein TadG